MVENLVAPQLAKFVARHFGALGSEWLAGLPERIERYRVEWELEIASFLPGGLMSCCLAVTTTEGQAAVLKLAGPWTPARPEVRALKVWNGGPAPRLLRADAIGDAFLLERIAPGQSLASAGPDEIRHLGRLVRCLHDVGVSEETARLLPRLADVVESRIATAGAEAAARSRDEAHMLAPRLERARRLARKLLSSREGNVTLLHGDLENRNILQCSVRGLVAIDPLPCVGDAAYDAGYWLGNIDRDERDEASVWLAEHLDLDHTRLLAWAAVATLEA